MWHTFLFILEIFLITIGIIALFSVLSGLFFALYKGPKKIFSNNPIPPVTDPDFLLALSYSVTSPIESGGKVEVLNNGAEFFPSLIKEIDGAERSVNFTVYIWKDGKASDMILDSLIRKQKEGVQVRILLDSFGSQGAPAGKFQELIDAGGKVERFRSLRIGNLTRFHRRSHRRSIVIDGKVGFTGGMAVKDVWLGNAQSPDSWRDMMFKVTGPLARSLQSAFSVLWTSSCGEILFGMGIYPLEMPVQSDLKFIHLVSSPSEAMSLEKFLLMSFMSAKKSLIITTPYFVADNHTLEALKERVKAGVEVKLMLPNENIDNKTARWNAQSFYYDLLQAGVRIFEYQPTFLHSKYLVVDGRWSVIGSPNQNYRSRNLDEENVFGILDEQLGGKLVEIFAADEKLSREITLKTWKRRSKWLGILPRLSKIIEEQS